MRQTHVGQTDAVLRSVHELADLVVARAAASERLVVGVAGPPGAGKSTVAEHLVAILDGSRALPTALLPMDGFHLPQARLLELGRRDRMGAADTFDVDAFARTLRTAGEPGTEVVAPGFDRNIEEPMPGAVRIPTDTRVIVAEGNYLLHDDGGWEQIAPLLHLSVYVTVDRDIRLGRLIARHERFGKSEDDARAWALGSDEANARLIAAGTTRADELLRSD